MGNPHPPQGRETMTAVTEVPHVAGTVGEVGWGSSATELVLGRELLVRIIPVKWLVTPI